jgi:hypothetical protein
MNRELVVVCIIVAMLLLLIGQQYVIAKSIKSSSDEPPKPTRSGCDDAVGKKLSTAIALLFIAACVAFLPHIYKTIGNTLYLQDSTAGSEVIFGKSKGR